MVGIFVCGKRHLQENGQSNSHRAHKPRHMLPFKGEYSDCVGEPEMLAAAARRTERGKHRITRFGLQTLTTERTIHSKWSDLAKTFTFEETCFDFLSEFFCCRFRVWFQSIWFEVIEWLKSYWNLNDCHLMILFSHFWF